MSEERGVTIFVREYGYSGNYDSAGYPPHSLQQAIQIFQEALLEIPSDYRGDAWIDFEPAWSHGETYERVRIGYERPETAEEAATRADEERMTMAKWIEEQEALIARRKQEYGIA
ncbi:hypothetical protein BTE77_06540 [Ensifer adhaerens]|nr:hypothetical protein BTE77_06540 [Ensifer adhaerens]